MSVSITVCQNAKLKLSYIFNIKTDIVLEVYYRTRKIDLDSQFKWPAQAIQSATKRRKRKRKYIFFRTHSMALSTNVLKTATLFMHN